MLYTTSEISKMYNVSQKTILTWIRKGLKHMKGAKKSYIYKKEWIDEFIESQCEIYHDDNLKNIKKMPKGYTKTTFIKVV